jgi:hypothetical protein
MFESKSNEIETDEDKQDEATLAQEQVNNQITRSIKIYILF